MDFYGSDLGNRLINDALFPEEIKEFLKLEKELLSEIIPLFDSLVEVGCMQGRYLQWATKHVQNYIGIDIVSSYIEEGCRNLTQNYGKLIKGHFILGDAEKIDTILNWEKFSINPNRTILLFPFNSFGNMQNYLAVIKSLKKSGASFIISTYSTSEIATSIRYKYYEACKYSNLKKEKTNEGVVFSSKDGLWTIAYHQNFLLRIFKEEKLKVDVVNFAGIGKAYIAIK